MLTENFIQLFERYGEPDETRALRKEELVSLPQNMPDILKHLYAHYGRFVFRGGRLTIVHPLDLRDVMSSILGEDPDFRPDGCHAFAYSAFGEIFFWHDPHGVARVNLLNGEVFSRNLTTNPAPGAKVENGVYLPFTLSDDALDCFDLGQRPLFERARKTYGSLGIGECYGFVPAISLGGAPTIENIRRLASIAHFSILAQSQGFALIRVVDRVKKERVRSIRSDRDPR